MFWRLLQVQFCAAINKKMKYRFSQSTWRTGSFYSKLEALCLHTASQGIGTCIFCGCWLGFFLFWFGFLISFSVKGTTRFLAGRLKGSSQLMKDQKNMAVTHFPLFRTLIHKIIKLFNHKIKSLGSIPCSDKINQSIISQWIRWLTCFLALGTLYSSTATASSTLYSILP